MVLAQEQKVIGFGTVHNHCSNEAAQQHPGQPHALVESGHLWSPKGRRAYKGLLYAKCVCVFVWGREREKKGLVSLSRWEGNCWKNRVCNCRCNNFITACSGTWWWCSPCTEGAHLAREFVETFLVSPASCTLSTFHTSWLVSPGTKYFCFSCITQEIHLLLYVISTISTEEQIATHLPDTADVKHACKMASNHWELALQNPP